MKKTFILAIVAFSLLTGCQVAKKVDEPLTLRLDQIIFENLDEGSDKLSFDFYIDRNDLGLSEPDNVGGLLMSSDLATGLRAKTIVVSYSDFSANCEVDFFPHRCEVDYIDGQKEYSLEIAYPNGEIFKKKIVVQTNEPLDIPKISFPIEKPTQGDLLNISFKDVGATEYEITTNLCHPYEDNGINPCLDEVYYRLVYDNGKLDFSEFGQSDNAVLEGDGEIITINSDFPLFFEESIKYRVNASFRDVNQNGVKIIFGSSDYLEFLTR